MAMSDWTAIRVPKTLASRLNRLAQEMQCAHSEGRISVPTELCERIPPWYVVETMANEVEARRARSARPRQPRKSESV